MRPFSILAWMVGGFMGTMMGVLSILDPIASMSITNRSLFGFALGFMVYLALIPISRILMMKMGFQLSFWSLVEGFILYTINFIGFWIGVYNLLAA